MYINPTHFDLLNFPKKATAKILENKRPPYFTPFFSKVKKSYLIENVIIVKFVSKYRPTIQTYRTLESKLNHLKNINMKPEKSTKIVQLSDGNNQLSIDQQNEVVRLMENIKKTKEKSEKKNTKRAYQNAQKMFHDFCIHTFSFEWLETTEEDGEIQIVTPYKIQNQTFFGHLMLYISNMAEWGAFTDEYGLTETQPRYRYETINLHVAAICALHIQQGFDSPRTDQVNKYLKQVQQEQEEDGFKSKQAKALKSSHIYEVISNINTSKKRGIRDKAIILIGFVGCLRRSEIAGLCMQDGEGVKGYIEEDPEGDGLWIYLNRGKTAKDDKGRFVPKAKDKRFCPVIALRKWIAVAEPTKEIFLTVWNNDKIDDKQAIAGKTVNRIIQKYFPNEKILPTDSPREIARKKKLRRNSGHSFRVGAAVEAREAGADHESIMAMGGWKTDKMVRRYTDQVDRKKNTAALRIGLVSKEPEPPKNTDPTE